MYIHKWTHYSQKPKNGAGGLTFTFSQRFIKRRLEDVPLTSAWVYRAVSDILSFSLPFGWIYSSRVTTIRTVLSRMLMTNGWCISPFFFFFFFFFFFSCSLAWPSYFAPRSSFLHVCLMCQVGTMINCDNVDFALSPLGSLYIKRCEAAILRFFFCDHLRLCFTLRAS